MKVWRWLLLILLLPVVGAAANEDLIKAAERGNVAALRSLLDTGAPVNARVAG